MLFLLKEALSIADRLLLFLVLFRLRVLLYEEIKRYKSPIRMRMKNCSKHADLFVRLFARAITSEVPQPKV